MDIYSQLKADHDRMRALLQDLKQAGAPEQRGRLFQQLHDELISHSLIEEKLLYTSMMKDAEAADKAMEGFNEHHLADGLIEELNTLSPASPGWAPKVEVLGEILKHHMEEEEEKAFPKARAALDDRTAQMLGREFDRRKQQMMQALTPLANQAAAE